MPSGTGPFASRIVSCANPDQKENNTPTVSVGHDWAEDYSPANARRSVPASPRPAVRTVMGSMSALRSALSQWVVVASLVAGASIALTIAPSAPADVHAVAPGRTFQPLTPARIADTRPGGTTTDGQVAATGRVPAGGTLAIPVGGRAGVPANAPAAVINTTAIRPSAAGYLTVYPCGGPRPLASSLNYADGISVANPNELIAGVGSNNSICIYSKAATDVIVDVVGYVDDASAYQALMPSRILDTRPGAQTIDGQFSGSGITDPGATMRLQVGGRAGVPNDAGAVVLNVTSVGSVAPGHITVHPCQESAPVASSVNYAPGHVRANEIIAQLSDSGEVCLFALAPTHIVADAVGWLPQDTDYQRVGPARLTDSRAGGKTVDGQAQAFGRLSPKSTTELEIAGRAGVPTNASIAVLNITTVNAQAPGHLTVYDCHGPRPLASALNYESEVVNFNELVVGLGANGEICVYSWSATDLVIDVVGYVAETSVTLNPGRNATEFVLPANAHPDGVALVARVFLPDGSSPQSAGSAFPVAFGYHGSGGLHMEPDTPGDMCTQTLETTYQQMTDHLLSQGVAVIWIDSFYSRDTRFCEDNDPDFKQFAPPTMDNGLQQVVNRVYDTVSGETAFCTLKRFDCGKMMRIGTSEGGTAVLAPSHRYIDHSLKELFVPGGKLDGVATIAYHPLPANRPMPQFGMAISPGCGFYSAVPLSSSDTTPIQNLYYPSQDTYLELGTADDIPNDCVVRPGWDGRRQLQADEVRAREGIAPDDDRYRPTLYQGGPHALWPAQRPALEAKLTNLIQTYLK